MKQNLVIAGVGGREPVRIGVVGEIGHPAGL